MSDYGYDDEDDVYNPYESDDDEIMYDDDDDLALDKDKTNALPTRVPFDSFTSERLREIIDREIEEMASLLGVSRDLSQILLLHFRWNRDRLIDRYAETQTLVLKEVGELSEEEDASPEPVNINIPHPSLNPTFGRHSPPASGLKVSTTRILRSGLRSKAVSVLSSPLRKRPRREAPRGSAQVISDRPDPPLNACGVCFDTLRDENDDTDDTDASVGLSLRCKHRFCEDCWRTYLKCKIQDEAQCVIKCMEVKCPTSVEESLLVKLMHGSPDILKRYQTLLAESYVSAHPAYRFCPLPSCEAILHCPSVPRGSSLLMTTIPTVICCNNEASGDSGSSIFDVAPTPGHISCFGCAVAGGHEPVICKVAEMWLGAAKEDSGTAEWIKANTRTCPKCSNNIEKAGGCNRMVCRHCKFQFCWMCMKDWDVHGYNDTVCNAFVEPPRTATMDEAKANLERWLFYYDRFNNHEVSAKLEAALVKRTAEKMGEIQEASSLSWIETQFMQTAVEELRNCRQTLKWTYAMAHFLVKDNRKQIFEDIQADLEKAVEQLSQMLDEPIEEETVMDLRRKVLDKTVYVAKRHEVVLNDVARGLTDGNWSWTVSLE